MDSVQSLFSSARFNRYLLWFGVAVFIAGALALTLKLAGGSDNSSVNPDKGFHARLPAKSQPLKNADGITVKTFSQLDPQVRSTIHTFIGTVVARKNIDDSWPVVAPVMRAGYTRDQWAHPGERGLPVVPYPGVDAKNVQYFLDYATTKEILVEVGLAGLPGVKTRPVTFQLGLVPIGKGEAKKWLVDYWMPRWTPPVPTQ